MGRKSLNLIVILFAIIVLSACESKGYNEFLPDQCKTYNEFINLSSKEFYNALKANDLEITKKNYFDVVANTKSLIINSEDGSGDFDLSGIECFQYLNKLELNGMAINDITPLYELSRVEEVKINNTRVNSLDSLSNMVKITALTVNNTRTLQKLDGIETLTRLEQVDLSNNALTDIAKIAGLPNIKTLTLNNNELESIDILETLPKLTALDVNNNKIDFNDKESFNGFKQLQSLNIKNNQICNTKALASLENLIALDISANNLNNHLSVSDCTNTDADFSFLNTMNQMTLLVAESNHLTSISSLKDVNISSINHLSLKQNEIASIEPIIQNIHLNSSITNLFLNGNKLTSVPSINALTNLVYLDLSANELTDVADVFELTNVEELYLSKNKITTLPSLVGKLPKLKELDVSYNELTAVTDLRDSQTLVNVDLSFNKISSINHSFSNMSALETVSLISNIETDMDRVNLISMIDNSFINLPKLNFTNDNTLKLPFYTNNLTILNSFKELPQFTKINFNKILLTDIDETSLSLPNVTEVNVSENQITHLKWTNNLPKLTKLIANNNEIDLADFVPTHFGMITELYLANNKIVNETALSYLTNIETLSLAYNDLETTTFLNKNAKLKVLDLSNNKLTDTSGIVDLAVLEELNLISNQIITLRGLNNLPKLKILNYLDNPVQVIDGLSNIGLENFEVIPFYLTEITSNSFKSNKFKQLILENHNLQDINFVSNLTYVEELILNHVTETQSLNLDPLKNLTNLKVLALESNNITNIDALQNLTKLEYLSLRNNQITSNKLSTDQTKYVIDNFKSLTDLYLDNNNIQELNGLNSLTSLITLYIDTEDIFTIKNAFKDMNKLQTINGNYNFEPLLFTLFRYTSRIENSFNATTFNQLVFPENFGSVMTIDNSFTQATTLDFGNTSFTNQNIGFINDLTNLASLSFKNNQSITSLSNIDGLSKLANVDISNSAIIAITNSFNNCPLLVNLTVNNDSLMLNNSLNNLSNLKGHFGNLNNTSSLAKLKSLEVNQYYGSLDFIESLTNLETLAITQSSFATFELNTSNLTKLKSLDLTGTTINLIQNSFNNSSSLTSIKLGNMKSMNNVFNDLPNLKLSGDLLSIKTDSGLVIDTIENAFNRTNGFNHVQFNNQRLVIRNSFDYTQMTKLSFTNPFLVTELSGFNNTKLDNFELRGFVNLTRISGFAQAKITAINLNGTRVDDLSQINKTKLVEITLNANGMTENEIADLVNNSPILSSLSITNAVLDIDWLNVDTLNNLDYIQVNNISSADFARVLAKKTSEKTLQVHTMDKLTLRNALYNVINSNSNYLSSIVTKVDPKYTGNPTNDEQIKNKVVDYLLLRYTNLR